MRYVLAWLLGIFWAGVLLITVPVKPDLKERIKRIQGEISVSKAALFIKELLGRLKNAGKKDRMLKELSEGMAYISNMVVLGRTESLSAEMLLYELSDFSKTLSPVYLDMIHSLQVNDSGAAAEALYAATGEAFARDIGGFLAGWESLPPEDMKNTLELYTSALRDERETRDLRRDEAISDLIYLPAVINAMAVLMNFIYVAFFIEQKEALMELF